MSQMIAMAIPIVPENLGKWKKFTEKLNNEYRTQFINSRNSVGLRERSYFQHFPNLDIVILTLEGEDPIGSFRNIFRQNDDFTNWFVEQVKEIHGVDLRKPLPGPPPELVIDTNI
jgi:hypothetical protein